MALNLPNLKTLTPGKATGKAIGGVKMPKNVNPKALFSPPAAPKQKPPAQHQVSPYDQFTLQDPYDPTKIGSLAQSGYDADVANATRLAAMGQPSSASIGADYAARGAASNQIYQALAQHLAGIQGATVAQGNAGSAALGAQNAAAAGTMPNIPGADPAGSPIPTAGAQAVLGAQTAATGNYGATLQAAALSAGTQANQHALDAGTIAATDNTNNIQKTLASLLSGVPLVSARSSSMLGENQKVDASNLQTKLSVYQNLVNQQQFAATTGNKAAQAAADRALKQWETQQSNAVKTQLGLAADQTRTSIAASGNQTKAQIAAGRNATSRANNQRTTSTSAANSKRAARTRLAAGGAGGTTPSARRQTLTQAIKIINTTGGTKTTGTSPSGYKATIQASTSSGKPNPLSSPKDVPVDPSNIKTYKPPPGFVVINPPTATSSKSTTTVKNKPGSYTKYNRAASFLKSNGWTQAEIKAALRQYHP